MISAIDEMSTFEIWSQIEDRPYDRQTLLISGRIVSLRACQTSTPITHRAIRTVELRLE
jgi:hypothetical protein